jgi:hypothetical protein
MSRLTYTRAEWVGIAQLLALADRASVPPGLAERIDALLRETPSEWSEEPCALELDAGSAAAVQHLTAQRPVESRTLGEAEGIIRDHQREHHAAPYRLEHRTQGSTVTIAHLSDVHTLHTELAQHATRLRGAGATGELVLMDQAHQFAIARQSLWPEPAGEAGVSP